MIKLLQDFLLMLLFKEIIDSLFFVSNDVNNDAHKVERNSHTKYFFPRVKITNYNVLIDGRNFYDQSINDLIKQYDEIRKTATEQGDDYTTRCLLN